MVEALIFFLAGTTLKNGFHAPVQKVAKERGLPRRWGTEREGRVASGPATRGPEEDLCKG